MGRIKKEDRKPYTVRMPTELFERIKDEQDRTNTILNDLVVQCIETGLNQIKPDTLSIGRVEEESCMVAMPPDIMQAARTASVIPDDAPALIRQWVKIGKDITKSMNDTVVGFATHALPYNTSTTVIHDVENTHSPSLDNHEPIQSNKTSLLASIKNRLKP